jgi:hypothetical protein
MLCRRATRPQLVKPRQLPAELRGTQLLFGKPGEEMKGTEVFSSSLLRRDRTSDRFVSRHSSPVPTQAASSLAPPRERGEGALR